MSDLIIDKVYKNAVISDNLLRLEPKEKQAIILYLLKDKSESQLSKELGIPKSTIHDWKTLRQNNVGKNIHVSFCLIVRKLRDLQPEDITDWGRIEQIHEITGELLKKKK